jgi:hypothetical protein
MCGASVWALQLALLASTHAFQENTKGIDMRAVPFSPQN